MSDFDYAIVGAGAAGIGAAKRLKEAGASFALLEASHRIGGRGYTEEVLPGMPFDLGCHWLHSASLNPFTAVADELGIAYTKEGFGRGAFENGAWVGEADYADWMAFWDRQETAMERVAETGEDCSVWDATDRDSRWTPYYDSIMSLAMSHDSDQISVVDLMSYRDTDENWPLQHGYGTLLTRFGADLPVTLNAAVSEVDWSGSGVRLTTPGGVVSAGKVIVTVSTAILSGGDIWFTPDLPDWKQDAAANLPLGNHNRICIAFDREVFDPDTPRGFTAKTAEDELLSFGIRPFGFNYAVGLTGGRFADWLERAGQQASIDYVEEKLRHVFGSDIMKHAVARIVTAWRGDPWVKGAYSAAVPGQAHQRARLAEPVNERLYFAGEATSPDFFTTAHGAYLSGIAAAEAAMEG